MSNEPLVSVVIPTRNRKETVNGAINSILNSTCKNIEIIIIDDASQDGTSEYLKQCFGDKIKVVYSETHLMMVKARNLGAKNAKGEYVLFIDDDNMVDPKMIENLVNYMERNKTYGMVGPRMYFYDNKERPYLVKQKINLWTGRTAGIPDIPTNQTVVESDGIPNVFMVRREIFKRVGYFDEALIQTWTEPDFSFTIKKHGYKTVSCPEASTYHRVDTFQQGLSYRSISGGGFKQKAYFLTRNRFVILKRYGNIFQVIFFTLAFSWIYPLAYSLMALKYREFGIIKLYWLGFKDGICYLMTNRLKNSLI